MSAGSDIFSVLGQLQGRQQQLPPQFAATGNQPIRRFQLEQLRMVQPNMQRLGLGALAGPAQIGMDWLTGALSRRTGMTMTPEGGTFGSYMRSMRQRQDLGELARLSNQTDFNRIRRVISPAISAAYRGEDPDRVGALTNAITRDYIGLMDTGIGQMLGMLGLEDFLAPGGLSSSFARRMYVAGMGRRTAPGRMGLGVQQVMDITRQLEQRFRGPGGEDIGFTRGFNMREFGEMAMGMGQRGVLDITQRKDQMMGQFRDMAGALDALKDLLGRPDAPIPELMQTLDDMFGGGGLRAIPAARLERMVRQAQSLGRTLGLSNQALQQVMQGATLQAQGMGMQGELGAISALRAMPMAAAAQQITEEEAGRPTGRIRLGMMSPRERMQRMQETVLRTTNSDFTQRLAAMMKMRRMAGGELGGTEELNRMEQIATQIEAGKAPDTEDAQWMLENFQTGGFRRIMRDQGFDTQTTRRILSDRLGLQEEMANYDLSTPALRAFRAESIQQMAARMEGSALVTQALGVTGDTPAEERRRRARTFIEQMFEAKRTPEGLRQAVLENEQMQGNLTRIAEERGISRQQVASMVVEQVRSTGRNVLDRNIFGARAFEGAQAVFSTRGMARQEEEQQRAASEAAMNASMARAGFGQARGGLGGMVQNFLRAVAEGGPGADIEELAARTLGGVPTEQLRAAMKDEDIQEQVRKMQDLTSSLKDLNEQIQEATGQEREQLEAAKGEREAELAAITETLKGLRRFLRPEEAQAAAAHTAGAMRLEAAIESGDKAALAGILEQYAEAPTSAEMLAATKNMTEEQRKKYLKLMMERSKLAREALSPDATAEEREADVDKLKELELEAARIRKQIADRPAEEDLKKMKKEQEEKKKKELEKESRIKKEKDKALADESTDLEDPRELKKIKTGEGGTRIDSTVRDGVTNVIKKTQEIKEYSDQALW